VKYTISGYLAAILVFGLAVSPAADGQESHFRGMMQELGRQMGRLSEGIMADDMVLVASSAISIADHPKPPMSERIRIVSELGTDATAFRAIDTEVHDTAMAIHTAAKEGDRVEVTNGFHKLVNSCLACHTRFRGRLRSTLTE